MPWTRPVLQGPSGQRFCVDCRATPGISATSIISIVLESVVTATVFISITPSGCVHRCCGGRCSQHRPKTACGNSQSPFQEALFFKGSAPQPSEVALCLTVKVSIRPVSASTAELLHSCVIVAKVVGMIFLHCPVLDLHLETHYPGSRIRSPFSSPRSGK